MRINRFEDVIAWQKGQDLAVFIYETFGQIKDFSFKDQICRASVSVSNNVAEGFDRGGDKEFVRFLTISRASNSEVKSMIYLAQKLKYLDSERTNYALSLCDETGKVINGLITYLSK